MFAFGTMREYILSKISVLVARPAVAATEAMHLFDTASAFPKLSTEHQWLFQISMKLPRSKIELGPFYDRIKHIFSFSGLKMMLSGL